MPRHSVPALRHLRMLSLAACALLGATAGAAAQTIELYERPGFGGGGIGLDTDVADLTFEDFNDRAASVRVGPGESWILCEHANFRGRCISVEEDEPDLFAYGLGYTVSSVRFAGYVGDRPGGGFPGGGFPGGGFPGGGFPGGGYPGGGYPGGGYPGGGFPGDPGAAGLTLFENVNYRGRPVTLPGDTPDLSRFGFNDVASSLRVAPGETWQVCVDANYRGACRTVRSDDPNLVPSGWNDRISSARRVATAPTPPRPPVPGGGGRGDVVMFEHAEFRGRQITVDRDIPDLTALGFSAVTSSFGIRGGGAWEFCDRPYFRGQCRVFSTDERNLANRGFNDRIASVRRARAGGFEPPLPPVLVLYQDSRMRGRAVTLDAGLGNFAAIGFAAMASSAQVRGRWEVCSAPNHRGRCVVIENDVWNFSDLGLNDQIWSARPLY